MSIEDLGAAEDPCLCFRCHYDVLTESEGRGKALRVFNIAQTQIHKKRLEEQAKAEYSKGQVDKLSKQIAAHYYGKVKKMHETSPEFKDLQICKGKVFDYANAKQLQDISEFREKQKSMENVQFAGQTILCQKGDRYAHKTGLAKTPNKARMFGKDFVSLLEDANQSERPDLRMKKIYEQREGERLKYNIGQRMREQNNSLIQAQKEV